DALENIPTEIRKKITLNDGTLSKVMDYQSHHFESVMSSMCVFLSLSEEALNTTMWSHYADSHRGFVIGFDEKHPYFAARNEFEFGLQKVTYANRRYMLDLQRAANDDDQAFIDDFVRNVILTKSDAWAYEKEWRLVRYPKDADMVFGRYAPH